MNLQVGIRLGPLDRAHIEKIRVWRNSHEIWKWCRQADVISDAAQEDWYERQHRDPTIRMYAVHFDAGGLEEIVGVCGLTSLCFENRRAEFSLYIAPEHQSKGFGEGALSALLKHAFQNLGLNQVWGEVFDGNIALALFGGLGFEVTGKRPQFYWRDGKFIDSYLISLSRDKWISLTSQSSPSSEPSSQGSSPASSVPQAASAPAKGEKRLRRVRASPEPSPESPASAESPSS